MGAASRESDSWLFPLPKENKIQRLNHSESKESFPIVIQIMKSYFCERNEALGFAPGAVEDFVRSTEYFHDSVKTEWLGNPTNLDPVKGSRSATYNLGDLLLNAKYSRISQDRFSPVSNDDCHEKCGDTNGLQPPLGDDLGCVRNLRD